MPLRTESSIQLKVTVNTTKQENLILNQERNQFKKKNRHRSYIMKLTDRDFSYCKYCEQAQGSKGKHEFIDERIECIKDREIISEMIISPMNLISDCCCCSVTKSCLTLRHGFYHTRLLCTPLSPGVCSNSCHSVDDAI